MIEPTITDIIFEILERPHYQEPFTTSELLTIIEAEKVFDKPLSVASVRLRLNHLVKVGKVIRVDLQHVVARRVI